MTTQRTMPLGLAGLLTITLAATAAGAGREEVPYGAKQCIGRSAIRDETAETDSHLILHVSGGKAYRSYLPTPCDNLRHINTISKIRFRSADPDKLCQGDTLEILDHDGLLGVGGDPQSVKCTLGRFEPISEMSLNEDFRR